MTTQKQQHTPYDAEIAARRFGSAARNRRVGYLRAKAEDADLLATLGQIANSPEGVYSRDKVQYLKNVISWCQETAAAAIAKTKGGA